ncbi:hypothetical protein [Microbispora sp. GKU 823]|uniref:hypothetical protein n=1 Tax=Microbispora sp. GKU 823 TaxID=1652100 RepID=UPI0009A35FD4|nr:hypothetical protein [Microbispora sp. GKU 823]OPG13264.1 hypothetical protein B1L11_09710 [Microbispora sp. GKU 823]
MSSSLDPEIAEALAPMADAMAEATPPGVGDIEGRWSQWRHRHQARARRAQYKRRLNAELQP